MFFRLIAGVVVELLIVQTAVAAGVRKVALKDEHILHYLLRAMLAGLYLGLIVFLYWNLIQNLGPDPFGKVAASLFFGLGLFVIIITNSELFTSNNMYLTMSSLAGKTPWAQAARLWAVCWIGNLLGSIAIALLIFGAGLVDTLPPEHALFAGAVKKAAIPSVALFFRGILANWVVCMAVWVNLHLKEEITRMFSIILIVSVFLYLGFEHSIANMGLFAYALLGHSAVTLEGVGHNLLWSTLGNMVGGGFFIAVLYWGMNKRAFAAAK